MKNMNRYSISDKKNNQEKTREIRFLEKSLSDEELGKKVRQAVKSVAVPADLESNLRKLLRKQL